MMKSMANRSGSRVKKGTDDRIKDMDQLHRQVAAMFGLLAEVYGPDKLVLKAGKVDALNLMRSPDIGDKVLALQRLVFEDPTIDAVPADEGLGRVISEVEDQIADVLARRKVEEKIEKKVSDRMQQRHEDYVKEIRMQVLKEDSGPDTPDSLRKLDDLKKLELRNLARSAVETVRPSSLAEIVGQDRALKALLSKISSPYPQHVILYGPPGVGKTTAARLALEEAKRLPFTPFEEDAKFVEVDGTTLRWDPREVTNPLMGSVHDPIYQGAKRDLAEGAVPEPKLGLVTEAHGGVLFIDEIGEMDPALLNKLLKVMEDKRVSFDSSYYDSGDPNVPSYIRKLFEDGAPADFILIGATTKDPSELSPALRSRTAEVYFEPLTQKDIQTIVVNAAAKLGVSIEPDVPCLISDYTIEGRKATNLLIDAHGLALYDRCMAEPECATVHDLTITRKHLEETIRVGRLSPYVATKASDTAVVGKVFGLGVSGFVGSIIEIEAVAFPAHEPGKGGVRFNDTAGTMAKDSVFNAVSVFRRITGEDLSSHDVHVNVVGGGDVDGPSAGTAIFLAILSSVKSYPIRQDVAVTGELSIQGKVREVGGIFEKIYGARQAGMKKVLIPAQNLKDVPSDMTGIAVIPISDVTEALEHVFEGEATIAGKREPKAENAMAI